MEKYTLVPRFVLLDEGLSDGAFRVYCLMQDYAFNNVFCFPSLERMADDLEKSLPTIKRSVAELREKGLVAVYREHSRANNMYVLVPEGIRKDGIWVLESREEFNELVERVRKHYEDMGRATSVKKSATKRKKKVETDLDAVRSIKQKMEEGDYTFTVKELAAIYKWANQEYRQHPVTINYGGDYGALRTLFGDKETYGKFEMLMLIKYVQVYDNLFKAPKYPHPSLWGFTRSWQYDKVKALVDKDLEAEARASEVIVDEVY